MCYHKTLAVDSINSVGSFSGKSISVILQAISFMVSLTQFPGVVLRRVVIPLFQTMARQKLSCCHGDHPIHLINDHGKFQHVKLATVDIRLNTSSCTPPYLCLDFRLQMEPLLKRWICLINISSTSMSSKQSYLLLVGDGLGQLDGGEFFQSWTLLANILMLN